ncbi:hypothetical protein DPMN_165695 [Dreissena polymorpha]|uniref:Uncharacterized protein n=1 Tax=Dreissena polymorpha TaxID=45954 RepID=A0A9D4EVD2_DREPO|nr:hypothetical protein DPMN_165695 [Dreissena polymorpha]
MLPARVMMFVRRDKEKINFAQIRSPEITKYARKNAPPPGSHVFQPTVIIFEHFQDIIEMNLLTKFHEDRTVNVASRVLTRFYYRRIRKNALPLGSHVFQANIIIFELIQDIIETNFTIATNLLTKFHEDRTINVASKEKCLAPGGHVLKATKTIFEHIQDIIGTNLQTKFHDDQKINVTSRRPCFFLLIRTIFELNRHIQKTHVLTKFHEVLTCFHCIHIEKTAPPPGGHIHYDWAKIVTSRVFTRNTASPPGGHVFQRTRTIFELNQHIIKTNILTKLHEDWASNVTSTVLTSLKLSGGIIGTNVLTMFHEDRTRNVASSVHKAKSCCAQINLLTKEDTMLNIQLLTKFHRLLTKFRPTDRQTD